MDIAYCAPYFSAHALCVSNFFLHCISDFKIYARSAATGLQPTVKVVLTEGCRIQSF